MVVARNEVHRWTRQEFERLADTEILPPGRRIELIDGILYDMSPQNSRHATTYRLVQELLRTLLPPGEGFEIRGQLPLALDDFSEPEPDVAVVRGSIEDYRDHHPTTALLVVEVSDRSLAYDRETKIPLYAEHEVPESWIVNLVDSTLEVYRDPSEGAYRQRLVLRAGDTVSPVARPEKSLPVADLLP